MKSPQDIINHYKERLSMSDQKMVTAKEFWIWTEKAEYQDQTRRARAGEQVRLDILYTAPKFMVDQGLIVDAANTEVKVIEGQTDLLGFL
ncbi:hypothetical protein [Paenibacillus nuruki]|uniref:hypothetical protein n=1 Tax=Paenibacillus nuruki TaxID=1886670 RepID=UPI002805D2AE|nr:hypothetical protein [Paenibacillus nuruki]